MIAKAARTQIIELCRTTDLSLEAIAKKVGVCPDTVNKVILGYGQPTTEPPPNRNQEKKCEYCGLTHPCFIQINNYGWVPCLKLYLENSPTFSH